MDSVERAQDELGVVAPAPNVVPEPPKSLEEVIAGLRGFGIEEFEEILTIKTKGRDLRVKISNVPTSDEMQAVQASDEFKGYLWVKRVKVELLSRALSWIDGIDLHHLPPDKRFLPDVTQPDLTLRDAQVVLRNILMGWGQELVEVLWKVLMTHSQNIEDRLKAQFPDSATLTEVERRLFEQARKQIDAANKSILDEQVAAHYGTGDTAEDK